MNNPKIALYISLKKPKNCIQYGGTTVGPIIKDVIEESLTILNIERDYSGNKKIYTWMDEKVYPVENYIGKKKEELKSKHFNFVFVNNGDVVLDQLPKVNELIKENSSIMIYFA